MLRGLSTVNYVAGDVAAAVDWYTEVLGADPYFSRSAGRTPAYVEFRIGDYQHELGIIDRRFAGPGRPGEPGGAIVYWHVDDVQASFGRLLALGAAVAEEPIERGPGFVTASVIDPFGNLLGVMYNQHYVGVLASRPGA